MTTTALPHATVSDTNHRAVCERRLRRVLRLNALNSAVFGLVLAAAPGSVDRVLDTGQPGWIRIVGLGLLPFAAFCLWVSRQEVAVLRRETLGVVVGDLGWVVASVVTVLLGWYSGGGVIAVLAMAAVVDVFAVLQWTARRALR